MLDLYDNKKELNYQILERANHKTLEKNTFLCLQTEFEDDVDGMKPEKEEEIVKKLDNELTFKPTEQKILDKSNSPRQRKIKQYLTRKKCFKTFQFAEIKKAYGTGSPETENLTELQFMLAKGVDLAVNY